MNLKCLNDRIFFSNENTVVALIYARTATVDVRPEASCEAQIAFAYKFAKAHPSITIAGEYSDIGKSGHRIKGREGYIKLLKKNTI